MSEGSRLEAWMKSHKSEVEALPCDEHMNTGHISKQDNLPLQGHWGKRDTAADDDELMLNVLRCHLTY